MLKTWLLTQCILMFLLGQLIQILLISIPKIKEKARAASKPFSWKAWWDCDWNVVIGTLGVGALVIIGLDEIIKWKPAILEYVKWFFAGMGAFGSSVAVSKLSKYDKQLNDLLDIKSNVSDKVTGGTTTVKETMDKYTEVTGETVVPSDNK